MTEVSPNPHWITFSPDDTRAYAANHESNVVDVIDTATFARLASIPVDTSPHSIALQPRGALLAVAAYDTDGVDLVDTTTNTRVATVPAGRNPDVARWSRDGRMLYASVEAEGRVAVIDPVARRVVGEVPSAGPRAASRSPSTAPLLTSPTSTTAPCQCCAPPIERAQRRNEDTRRRVIVTGGNEDLTEQRAWPRVRPGPNDPRAPGPLPTPPEAGIDFENANAARMYDYLLGGSHNFAVDRELADRIVEVNPWGRDLARANRRFLTRAVRYCVDQGVRQFLDPGSGIPTADHVHGIARATAPETRVAYVDVEPVAVAYSDELLAGADGVTITRADIRDTTAVLTAPTVTSALDFTQPIALLALAVIHFIPDTDSVDAILASYRDALAPGSYLAISHDSLDYDDPETVRRMTDTVRVTHDSATPVWARDRDRIRELLGGGQLVEPGLVDVARWRADDQRTPELGVYGGITTIS